MEDLTRNLCWELVNKEGYIAVWQKPLNNSCYLDRDPNAQPSLCETDENPDDTWYVCLFLTHPSLICCYMPWNFKYGFDALLLCILQVYENEEMHNAST